MTVRLSTCMAGLVGLAMLLFSPLWGHAANLGISPVRVELSPANPTTALTLRNGDDEAIVVQLQVVAWSQEAGQDIYTPTTELIATPPIFTVPAGGAQVVRVGLRRAPDAQRELSYRLFLQEVPGPSGPGVAGLRMALRIGVPVFVRPLTPAKADLQWRAERGTDGALGIAATNNGNAHIQITHFTLTAAGTDQEVATQQSGAYLLPGQRKAWQLKPQSARLPDRVRLKAQTDAGEINAEFVVEKLQP